MAHITLLARSVILHENQVLLAQAIGQGHTFLPVDHVEQGEQAADTLRREIAEGIGLSAEVDDFFGAVEATWGEEPIHHELNLPPTTFCPLPCASFCGSSLQARGGVQRLARSRLPSTPTR